MSKELSGKRPLRICYFGTYRANYTRNQILIQGLRAQKNVVVYECHATLWRGIEDRVAQAKGGWRKPRFWWRVLKTYVQLLHAHSQAPEYDIMLIGYPGQFDSYLGRLLSWWRRKPLALDILMSLYLVAEERGLTRQSPITGRIIFLLEKGGLKLPDLLISENAAYEAYYCRQYNLPHGRFQRVAHGADERIYHPRSLQPPQDHFRVTYHGTFLPSHGLDAVIGAAILLHDTPDIQFHFYGTGPEKEHIETIAKQQELGNVIFHGFVDHDELLDGLAQSHICLGVFGMTRQSHYTIQNKVWEGLAMRTAVISGDSTLVRESLQDRKEIYLIERNNPQALADAICELKANTALREEMAQAGYARFMAGNSMTALGTAMVQALQTVL
jgi:glycosyltransferase involved in cell wall biosynthesis